MSEQPVVPVETVPDIVKLDMGRPLITGIVLNRTGSRQSCNRGSYGLELVLHAHRHALPVLAGTLTEVKDAPDSTLTIETFYSSKLDEDGMPCMVLDYSTPPKWLGY